MKANLKYFAGLAMVAMFTGCVSGPGPVTVGGSDDFGRLSTKIEPQDIRETVEHMTE